MKMKDLILEHYQKAIEKEMDGVTVRVWKPRTMQQLPSYKMLSTMDWQRHQYTLYSREKNCWWTDNPDQGAWDAQLTMYADYRHSTLDIYFCALLCRPFSKEANQHYGKRMGYDAQSRLMLMWDSREYDRMFCYDTSYGAYANKKEANDIMYSVKDEKTDIADNSEDFYGTVDCSEQKGMTIKFRNDGEMVSNETSWPQNDMSFLKGMSEKVGICCEAFLEFNKQHPEFCEVHFYTEPTQWEQDEEE